MPCPTTPPGGLAPLNIGTPWVMTVGEMAAEPRPTCRICGCYDAHQR
jgi:hypothetical protein